MEAEYADLANRIERHRLELVEMNERIEVLRGSIADLEYQASTVAEEKEKEEQEIAALTSRLEEARQRADRAGGRTVRSEQPCCGSARSRAQLLKCNALKRRRG